MRSGLRTLFFACASSCTFVLPDAAAAVTMGSLAPRDLSPAQNGQQNQQWATDPATQCVAADPNYDPGDTISWQGRCKKNGMIAGPGTLTFLNNGRTIETISGNFVDGMPAPGRIVATWPDGTKYAGEQLGYLFNGAGRFASPKGDSFDGEWKLGVLNGKASAVWANGDHYDGMWKNGRFDGQGVEVWADGRRYEGEWRDGEPVGNVQTSDAGAAPAPTATAGSSAGTDASVRSSAATIAIAQPTAPATGKTASFVVPAASNAASSAAPPAAKAAAAVSGDGQTPGTVIPLRPLMGTQLLAVDGATFELGATDDGFERTLVLPNGSSQEIEFAFANGPVGTVTNGDKAIGVFRARSGQLDIDYADGTTESIQDAGNGGLSDHARTADGRAMCTAWYPQGHPFSGTEKKAAVAEYAARLGVPVNAPSTKHATAHASGESCGGGFIAAGAEQKPADVNAASPASVLPAQARMAGERAAASAPLPAAADGAVAVKTSPVHPIDNPVAAAPSGPHLEQASFTTFGVSPNPVLTGSPPAAEPGASGCLSVTSNGEYWGFQNRCAKSVQFAYCEMSDANPLTSCKHTSVSGSVAASGFSALVSDRSLSEKSIDHEFRWMGCDGGAGEVVPHLDKIDPPSGRCERAVPPSQ